MSQDDDNLSDSSNSEDVDENIDDSEDNKRDKR